MPAGPWMTWHVQLGGWQRQLVRVVQPSAYHLTHYCLVVALSSMFEQATSTRCNCHPQFADSLSILLQPPACKESACQVCQRSGQSVQWVNGQGSSVQWVNGQGSQFFSGSTVRAVSSVVQAQQTCVPTVEWLQLLFKRAMAQLEAFVSPHFLAAT